MTIHTFETVTSIVFDSEAVIAFKQGKTLQIYGNDAYPEKWKDWEPDNYSNFGPWYHDKKYRWRVKPDTIEIEVEYEEKVVVKKQKKVEIPAPFKGVLKKDQDYFAVKMYGNKAIISDCANFSEDIGKSDVEENYVYFDLEIAEKARDIINQ